MLRSMSAMLLCFTAIGGSPLHAQQDSFTLSYYRQLVAPVESLAGLARLDTDGALAPGGREVRIYMYRFGPPFLLTRIWRDRSGIHGGRALFWDESVTSDSLVRDSQQRLRRFVDSAYNCGPVTESERTRLCWLEERPPTGWDSVLARLDSAGVESIRMPQNPKAGFDGWSIYAEVRNVSRYHAYEFWAPQDSASDSGERAAARVAHIVRDLFK